MALEGKKTDYILESDNEMSRLSNQHEVIKDAMGGLLQMPIDYSKGPLRILDSGTADGFWIQDLASSIPAGDHEFIGTDVNPSVFPKSPPPGQTYQVQDINKPWPATWHNYFDIVHQRLTLVGAGQHGQAVVSNLAELVKPGGWIQLIEGENMIDEKDGPAMHDFLKLMKDTFTLMGANIHFARDMAGWLKAVGFEDVQDRLFDSYLGATNKDPKLAQHGVISSSVGCAGLVEFAKTLPSGPPSLSKEELDTLGPRLRAELTERGGNYPLRVVWGRKPL
ncbi:MAG: hypothetical protein MMC33_002277 [Icmadophila ericetorum]|nr:hypothetical protein [Icmadophila ericetorum]